jgi:hydroxymethylbilane synthase
MVHNRSGNIVARSIRLASRGSNLALWQARHVAARLARVHPGLDVQIDVVHTTGDRVADVPLSMIGDRGLFTKEVDSAVLQGSAHAAVHSLKDLPTTTAPGLALAAVLERENPSDVFVPAPGRTSFLAELPAAARVGTSSLRRRALLLAARPDLLIEDLRGNLDTRLQKIEEGHYDGIVLALAGLRRLGREDVVGEVLGPPDWLPAAGQGALAVMVRAGDTDTMELFKSLDDADTRACTAAERAFLGALEGGCQVPIGALATIRGPVLHLHGLVASLDGTTIVKDSIESSTDRAVDAGGQLALRLSERGAQDVLRAVRAAHADTPPQAP